MALQEEFELQGNYLFKYRSYLPILLLLVGLLVYGIARFNSTTAFNLGFDLIEIIALIVCFIGFIIRVFTVGYTPKNTSGRNTEQQVADSLNTTGMYSIVRHPLYVGNFFMWLGVAILTANFCFVLVFILSFWIFYERIMFAEEQFLRRKFEKAYVSWAEDKGAFIPKLKSFVKPNLPFSWKKVLKKEKNGFFAVFLVFFIFNALGQFIEDGSWMPHKAWLIYSTILSALIYLVLKLIKKYTSMLDEENR